MKMKRTIITSATLLVALGVAAPTTQDPAHSAKAFYSDLQRLHVSGLPSRIVSSKLAPHLSAGLKALFAKADKQQDRCIKANPTDKGPWIEGDMFSSNFEGFSTVLAVKEKAATPDRVTLTVDFEFKEGKDRFTWTDQVVMIKEAGRWVVDDVTYRTQEGFGVSLRCSL